MSLELQKLVSTENSILYQIEGVSERLDLYKLSAHVPFSHENVLQ